MRAFGCRLVAVLFPLLAPRVVVGTAITYVLQAFTERTCDDVCRTNLDTACDSTAQAALTTQTVVEQAFAAVGASCTNGLYYSVDYSTLAGPVLDLSENKCYYESTSVCGLRQYDYGLSFAAFGR